MESFILWDTDTGNMVGAFDTEAEALSVVQHALRTDGAADVESLALVHETEQGEMTVLAEGTGLAQRALLAPGRPSLSA